MEEWHRLSSLRYVATQGVAAVIAGLVVRYVGGREAQTPVASAGKMLIAEFLFTFALAWVVLHVATARGTDGNSFYGLAIGFTVVTGAFAVGGISGGAFNPAIALGAMVTGLFEWSNLWIYLLADLPRRRGGRLCVPLCAPGRETDRRCRRAGEHVEAGPSHLPRRALTRRSLDRDASCRGCP